MATLKSLFSDQGQSPWLDNLKRDWLRNGQLDRWIERGIRGVTSNPTIFQKAIESSSTYDEEIAALVENGADALGIFWTLAISDVEGALDRFLPVYRASGGEDGFVSLELPPRLAHDAAGSIAEARRLHQALGAPNLYIKIPATAAGVTAFEQLVAEGRNINVTLLFSMERYEEIATAYLAGLEDHEGDLSRVCSVASFFVSRVDTEVDRRLEQLGTPEALALRGQAAIAQAQLAYELFTKTFSGPRWTALRERGAHPQRLLWASTSTKNPAYPDTKYPDALIGPMTVDTMPEETLTSFEDHGQVRRSLDHDLAAAHRTYELLRTAGIDFADVGRTLEEQGVDKFERSFDDLIAKLEARIADLRHGARPTS
jgi:transaldolase